MFALSSQDIYNSYTIYIVYMLYESYNYVDVMSLFLE